jgi:phosphoribosylpyrophosphate synthetase
MPGIEFNQSIPEDIDNADYLDVSQRNLIVLDDLIAQSGKDKRIADLLYERKSSFVYHLYCPKYISSGQRNEKYQS